MLKLRGILHADLTALRGEMADEPKRHPLLELDDADREFILRFVLSSGSLKELARAYGVSYPTIRSRLDRLIERLRSILEGRRTDPMSALLANLVERGELTVSAARSIQALHRQLLSEEREA